MTTLNSKELTDLFTKQQMLTNQRQKRGYVIAGGERSVTLGLAAYKIIVRKQMVVFVQTVLADETKHGAWGAGKKAAVLSPNGYRGQNILYGMSA